MGSQLDTSGCVRAMPHAPYAPCGAQSANWYCWSDLTPFAQGYTAPILEAVNAPFHRLAPATLARIIEDCERASQRLDDKTTGGGMARREALREAEDLDRQLAGMAAADQIETWRYLTPAQRSAVIHVQQQAMTGRPA